MLKALLGLGGLLWALPIALFCLTSALMGRWDVCLSILALAVCSTLFGAAGYFVADDPFEGFVSGAFIGLMLCAWPVGHYIIG